MTYENFIKIGHLNEKLQFYLTLLVNLLYFKINIDEKYLT